MTDLSGLKPALQRAITRKIYEQDSRSPVGQAIEALRATDAGKGQRRGSNGPSPVQARVTLPYPPSANRYWRKTNRGLVYVSAEAKQYKHAVFLRCRTHGVSPVAGNVVLHLDVFRPARRGDLDNCLKVCIDSLKGLAFGDDSLVVGIHARRFEDKHQPRIEVRIEAEAH